jgi:hypothetical protein
MHKLVMLDLMRNAARLFSFPDCFKSLFKNQAPVVRYIFLTSDFIIQLLFFHGYETVRAYRATALKKLGFDLRPGGIYIAGDTVKRITAIVDTKLFAQSGECIA